MQLQKYTKLIKREGFCGLRTVGEDSAWLASRSAIFRAGDFPTIRTGEEMRSVLDLADKDWAKVTFSAGSCESLLDVLGQDLRDHVSGDQPAKKLEMQAVLGGVGVTGLLGPDGELIFFDDSLLSPVQKEIDGSHYVEYIIRKTESGQRYVVVKNGFDLIAAVMPVKVIDMEYLGKLQEFQTLCIQQFEREKIRREVATVRTATEEGGPEVSSDE